MNRQEDFAKASAQFDGIYAQVAFSTGCEYGHQYAIPEVCHIIRMIYIQNGNKLPSNFEDIVNHRIKTL